MATQKEIETPVLHVLVVGFHHKKGCQVEYSYPPVIAGNAVDSHELPEDWKHLPSLALPDGAHNYQQDTVFFHLPSRDSSRKTVYCVSCYRQIDAKDLLNRTADITRSTVQKSVCVLSRLPLYGLLKAKLELITHAYFDERDFSKVELLEQTFNNLNASLSESLLNSTQVFLSLSPREAVARFKHKLLVLFKLILLERRVLFFGSPVEVLGTTLLSVLSLYPGMLEFGLVQAVSDDRQRLVSPTMGVASLDPGDEGTGEDFVEVRYHQQSPDKDKAKPGAANSELSELLPFVHNNTLVMSEPPESPTIPRDVAAFTSQEGGDNRQRQMSGPAQLSSDSESPRKPIVVARSISVSGLEVHKTSNNPAEKGKSTTEGRVGGVEVGSRQGAHSPLEDVSLVTQISAVQTGHTLPNHQAAVEDYIHKLDLKAEGAWQEEDDVSGGGGGEVERLSFQDPLLAQSDSMEDLDSPESLSRIDREDCFSWEEDRLKLSLDIEEGSESGSRSPTAVDSPSQESSTTPTSPDPSSSTAHTPSEASHQPQTFSTTNQSSKSTSCKSGSLSPAKASPVSGKKATGRLGSPGKGGGSPGRKTAALKSKLTTAFGKVGRTKGKDAEDVEMKPVIRGEVTLQQDDFGFPLAVFTKGCVCHPYLSLQFHSILNDVNVRSFLLGATNILFRQLKPATDVIVEVEEGKLEIKDRELQKHLNLTTADLRFSELLVRQVTEEKNNMYLDGTEWEGSDEWVRAQFRSYLQSLLATMQTEDGRMLEDFGLAFISAWRTTHNYRHWLNTLPHPKMADVPPGHPCSGNLSVTDVRMKLNHSMQSTERGRKINAAVVQTGKYVLQTSKAVGGAFSSARSAVSSWFTSITNDWRHEEEEEEEQKKEGEEEEEEGERNEERKEEGKEKEKRKEEGKEEEKRKDEEKEDKGKNNEETVGEETERESPKESSMGNGPAASS